MNANTGILEEKFNLLYSAGQKALDEKNLEVAKFKFAEAAETLRKIADYSSPKVKEVKLNRAVRIDGIVSQIESEIERGKREIKASFDSSKEETEEDTSETKWTESSSSDVKFDDIVGMEKVKKIIREKMINQYLRPDVYEKYKIKADGGIMMYGLPGTGKTFMGKAIAGELGVPFYYVKCSDIFSKWVGESEKNIKNLFAKAKESGKAVIFLDDCESLCVSRDKDGDVSGRIVSELLTQMSGFEDLGKGILVIGATNCPWKLDSALLRPERFTSLIYVPLPDEESRRFMINKDFENIPVAQDVDLEILVQATEGGSSADVLNLCRMCKIPVADKIVDQNLDEYLEITVEDITKALKEYRSSIKPGDVQKMKEYMNSIGVDEQI